MLSLVAGIAFATVRCHKLLRTGRGETLTLFLGYGIHVLESKVNSAGLKLEEEFIVEDILTT